MKFTQSLILLLFFSSSAYAYKGTFYAPSLVPNKITHVEFYAYNYARTGQPYGSCGDTECYRIDVYLNNIHVATFPTSPGKPHPGTKHVGGYTPNFNGTPVHTLTSSNYVSYRRRYYMPYAMFFESLSRPGKISDYAIHSGHAVTGKRISRGCFRTYMNDAALMFNWTFEARRNGGNGYVYAEHMNEVY